MMKGQLGMLKTASPLSGVVVVDATTSLGEYAGRLLADLGADVTRVEAISDSTDIHRRAFLNAGKRLADPVDDQRRDTMISGATMLLTSEGPAALASKGLSPEVWQSKNPSLVHVAISPFGLTGPYADRPASDLTLLAAGGLLALAGDPFREPIRPWGEQTTIIAGTHAVVAALIALEVAETEGYGQVVDLSVQEAVAQSTENAIQYFDLEGVVRHRTGSGNSEAGTGLFHCADGLIYLVGGLGGKPLAWSQISAWLVDGGIDRAADLTSEVWQDPQWRRSDEAVSQFRDMFEEFAASRSKQDLFDGGQRRGISVSPVSTPADLLVNPQLVERDYFRRVEVEGREHLLPGAPYRFAESFVQPRNSPNSKETPK